MTANPPEHSASTELVPVATAESSTVAPHRTVRAEVARVRRRLTEVARHPGVVTAGTAAVAFAAGAGIGGWRRTGVPHLVRARRDAHVAVPFVLIVIREIRS